MSIKIWAKSKDPSGSVITLCMHIFDILETWDKLFENIKNKLSFGSINKENTFKEAVEYLIKGHDLGKVSPVFQIYTLGNKDYPTENFGPLNNNAIPHSILSLLFLSYEKLEEISKKICSEFGYEQEPVESILMSCIAFHHWKKNFADLINPITTEEGKKLIEIAKEHKEGRSFLSHASNILKEHLGPYGDIVGLNNPLIEGLSKGVPLSEQIRIPYGNTFSHHRIAEADDFLRFWILLAGFLQRCDHYASYIEKDGGKYEDVELGLDDLNFTQNVFNFTLNPERTWQYKELSKNNRREKNVILIAPTGQGKTEFALFWSKGEKLFFTLPLRSSVNAMYKRLKEKFGEDKVGLLHSDADLALLSEDKDQGDSMRIYEASKQLSLPILVSTGDQFFPYALKPPGYEKVWATFSYSRLVIDEVQAYDPVACAIVVKFIQDVYKMGGKFLLMTATMPDFVLEEIKNRVPEEELEEIDIYEDKRNILEKFKKHKIEFVYTNKRKKELNYLKKIEEDIDNIIKKAEGKRALVICNTVNKAIKVYEKIKEQLGENAKVFLLHSHFTQEDRERIEKDILNEFKNPKPEEENETKILVATQVVEASLDIDADLLFTELPPLDALVQRMGRCLRRYFMSDGGIKKKTNSGVEDIGEKSPVDDTNVYIYNSDSKGVYEEEVIKATYDELKNRDGKHISEYEKYEMVKKFYDNLNEYRQKFDDMLEILDTGYRAENKNEAQELFRRIFTLPTVPQNKLSDFEKALKEFIKDYIEDKIHHRVYTEFKKRLIAKYVVNLYRDNTTKPILTCINLDELLNSIPDDEKKEVKKKEIRKKLESYLNGIYVSEEYEYDNEKGAKRKEGGAKE